MAALAATPESAEPELGRSDGLDSAEPRVHPADSAELEVGQSGELDSAEARADSAEPELGQSDELDSAEPRAGRPDSVESAERAAPAEAREAAAE